MNKFTHLRSLLATVLPLLLLLPACFHKDVMNDRADDVTQSFIYTGKDGPLIITQEQIFQATSKSSGGGISRTSGYNECRLTSYDLTTGAIVGRVELGEEMEAACKIVALTDGAIWCYSIDPELGLHSRNPKTLEVQKKEADFSALTAIQLARPEWTRISDYYAFEFATGKIMITDMQGLHYYFDATGNATEKTENEMPRVEWSPDYLNNTAYFAPDSFVAFDGTDDRKRLQWKYEDTTADLPFLKPEFFVDQNEQHANDRKLRQAAMIRNRRDSLKAKVEAITADHPVFNKDYVSWSDMTAEERTMSSDFNNLRRDMEAAEFDLNEITGTYYDNNEYALGDQPYSCLVYSANSIADTAHVILTCVDTKAKKFTERWHLDLSSFYYDPDKAEGAGVFDEGDPEFRYRWADIYDGKFVMIAQLQMVCIDLESGKKLWEIPL